MIPARVEHLSVHDLRALVAWANGQNENILDSADGGPLSVAGLLQAYRTCDNGRADMESVLGEGDGDERATLRRALRMRVRI